MLVVRTLVLAVLFSLTAGPVGAQNETVPSNINPVDAAISADNPELCDAVGWSLLREEIPTGAELAHHMSCHRGAGIAMFGGCAEPMSNADSTIVGKHKSTRIYCWVSVMVADENSTIKVVPADFILINEDRREYRVAPAFYDTLPSALRLRPRELKFNETAGGFLVFEVDEPLAEPFLLAWDLPINDPLRLAAIVVDRLDPATGELVAVSAGNDIIYGIRRDFEGIENEGLITLSVEADTFSSETAAHSHLQRWTSDEFISMIMEYLANVADGTVGDPWVEIADLPNVGDEARLISATLERSGRPMYYRILIVRDENVLWILMGLKRTSNMYELRDVYRAVEGRRLTDLGSGPAMLPDVNDLPYPMVIEETHLLDPDKAP